MTLHESMITAYYLVGSVTTLEPTGIRQRHVVDSTCYHESTTQGKVKMTTTVDICVHMVLHCTLEYAQLRKHAHDRQIVTGDRCVQCARLTLLALEESKS
jgi:hypothetical protein